MTQHFTSNTISQARWCNACKRQTQHSVSGNRLGRCMEHGGGAIATQTASLKPNTVDWPPACLCPAYKFPHLHEAFLKRWDAEHRGAA